MRTFPSPNPTPANGFEFNGRKQSSQVHANDGKILKIEAIRFSQAAYYFMNTTVHDNEIDGTHPIRILMFKNGNRRVDPSPRNLLEIIKAQESWRAPNGCNLLTVLARLVLPNEFFGDLYVIRPARFYIKERESSRSITNH
jgi:hypothetical protein